MELYEIIKVTGKIQPPDSDKVVYQGDDTVKQFILEPNNDTFTRMILRTDYLQGYQQLNQTIRLKNQSLIRNYLTENKQDIYEIIFLSQKYEWFGIANMYLEDPTNDIYEEYLTEFINGIVDVMRHNILNRYNKYIGYMRTYIKNKGNLNDKVLLQRVIDRYQYVHKIYNTDRRTGML